MRNGLESRNRQLFEVRQFKNPINANSKSGFRVETTDAQGFTIGQSSDLTLPGVVLPADFADVKFIIEDDAGVGRYSNFRI